MKLNLSRFFEFYTSHLILGTLVLSNNVYDSHAIQWFVYNN